MTAASSISLSLLPVAGSGMVHSCAGSCRCRAGQGGWGRGRQVITILASHYILAAVEAWGDLDAFQMCPLSYSHQTGTSFQFKKCGCSAWSLIHITEPCSFSILYPWRMYLGKNVHSYLL